MNNLDAIFVNVDDFCQAFLPAWQKHLITSGTKQRNKPSRLSTSEVMTIVISFHQSGYRDFKTYYTGFVCRFLTKEFPELVSYTRMLKLLQSILVPLCSYLTHRHAKPTGIAFVDSTKLHLIINDQGGIMSVKITTANVDDRKPVPEMADNLWSTLYGDKGSISGPLEQELADKGVRLITDVKKNMKPKMMKLWDRLMLRKRFIIETVFDQLKNISQIEHSRHRSCVSFMVNLLAGLIAYSFQPKKPSIKITRLEKEALMCRSEVD
ncbi:IS982 family transposase [Vibrio mimicus]